MQMDPTSIGLFAGIGGFEIALGHTGHRPVLLCEIEPAAQSVLSAWQPQIGIHPDIRDIEDLKPATVLCAGFPCQDLSISGLKAGISGTKSSLVQHVFRLLARRRIPNLIIENVPFMLHLDDGTGIAAVTGALEHLGYRWAYRVVDSRYFGVPQRRQRVFIFASTELDPRAVLLADDAGERKPPRNRDVDVDGHALGFYWSEGLKGLGLALDAVPPLKGGSTIGIPTPPAVLLPDGTLGTPDIEDAERLQALPSGWTAPGDRIQRNARWRLVGNAVTTSVVRWIGGRMHAPGRYDMSADEPLLSSDRYPRAAYNMGNGRFASFVSQNPIDLPMPRIASYLHRPLKPLSARATAGFLDRARRSTLHFPAGFLDRVGAHLERMRAVGSA